MPDHPHCDRQLAELRKLIERFYRQEKDVLAKAERVAHFDVHSGKEPPNVVGLEILAFYVSEAHVAAASAAAIKLAVIACGYSLEEFADTYEAFTQEGRRARDKGVLGT
jgi:hypothetical protein